MIVDVSILFILIILFLQLHRKMKTFSIYVMVVVVEVVVEDRCHDRELQISLWKSLQSCRLTFNIPKYNTKP